MKPTKEQIRKVMDEIKEIGGISLEIIYSSEKINDKAKMINKMFYKPLSSKGVIPIVLSGGTNSLSRELAEAAWVRCNGIAIGTFARDIVEDFVRDEKFYSDIDIIKSAYKVAKSLVDKNKMSKEL